MKKLTVPIAFSTAFFLFVSASFAATLTLDKIGTYEVATGKPAGKIFYTDHFPTFSGKASANAQVTISIAGFEDGAATAAADGAWSYKPTKEMTKGDYKITVASGSESFSFELGIETGLPVSGFDLTLVLLIGSLLLSLSLLGLAYKRGLLTLRA